MFPTLFFEPSTSERVLTGSYPATHIHLPAGVPDPAPEHAAVSRTCALRKLTAHAKAAGLQRQQIILDPGLELGKTWWQPVSLLAAMNRYTRLGYPLLLSPSHKIFLGRLLRPDEHEHGPATTAATAIGVLRGSRVLRVHDARQAPHATDSPQQSCAADAETPMSPSIKSQDKVRGRRAAAGWECEA